MSSQRSCRLYIVTPTAHVCHPGGTTRNKNTWNTFNLQDLFVLLPRKICCHLQDTMFLLLQITTPSQPTINTLLYRHIYSAKLNSRRLELLYTGRWWRLKRNISEYGWLDVLTAVCVATLRYWDSSEVFEASHSALPYFEASRTFEMSLSMHRNKTASHPKGNFNIRICTSFIKNPFTYIY